MMNARLVCRQKWKINTRTQAHNLINLPRYYIKQSFFRWESLLSPLFILLTPADRKCAATFAPKSVVEQWLSDSFKIIGL